jgi:predicted transcriptional regulator
MKKEEMFTNSEIRKNLRIAESTLRRYHTLLVQEGYLKKQETPVGSSYSYKIVDVNEFNDLESGINKALDVCLESLLIEK